MADESIGLRAGRLRSCRGRADCHDAAAKVSVARARRPKGRHANRSAMGRRIGTRRSAAHGAVTPARPVEGKRAESSRPGRHDGASNPTAATSVIKWACLGRQSSALLRWSEPPFLALARHREQEPEGHDENSSRTRAVMCLATIRFHPAGGGADVQILPLKAARGRARRLKPRRCCSDGASAWRSCRPRAYAKGDPARRDGFLYEARRSGPRVTNGARDRRRLQRVRPAIAAGSGRCPPSPRVGAGQRDAVEV